MLHQLLVCCWYCFNAEDGTAGQDMAHENPIEPVHRRLNLLVDKTAEDKIHAYPTSTSCCSLCQRNCQMQKHTMPRTER